LLRFWPLPRAEKKDQPVPEEYSGAKYIQRIEMYQSRDVEFGPEENAYRIGSNWRI